VPFRAAVPAACHGVLLATPKPPAKAGHGVVLSRRTGTGTKPEALRAAFRNLPAEALATAGSGLRVPGSPFAPPPFPLQFLHPHAKINCRISTVSEKTMPDNSPILAALRNFADAYAQTVTFALLFDNRPLDAPSSYFVRYRLGSIVHLPTKKEKHQTWASSGRER